MSEFSLDPNAPPPLLINPGCFTGHFKRAAGKDKERLMEGAKITIAAYERRGITVYWYPPVYLTHLARKALNTRCK